MLLHHFFPEKQAYFLTVLLFVKEEKQDEFLRYERKVLPLLNEHKGKLLYRFRPTQDQCIDLNGSAPFEIHILRFESQDDFEAYQQNSRRTSYQEQYKGCIENAVLIEGNLLGKS